MIFFPFLKLAAEFEPRLLMVNRVTLVKGGIGQGIWCLERRATCWGLQAGSGKMATKCALQIIATVWEQTEV